ncbi:putative odorant receptor 92a [Vespula pensylvanica]|uniref:putative odorant receptor 92a n=1 Tax=Vespula pensylvanica TaxID=30213 RepID=UPI001CBA1FA4|nr:putative odorant receptor 92a [Vespula pensylvanica]
MKFTPEAALNFTRKSVAIIISWPPPINISKKVSILLDIYLFVSFLLSQVLLSTLVYGMYIYDYQLDIVIRSSCVCVTVVQTNIKMLIARLNRTNMQQIVVEMETVIREATPSEKAVLEKYVNRSATLHICLTFGFYLASINMLIGPLFLPQPFPGYSVFPFKTDTHPIYEIAYFAVSYPGLQSSAAATVDCQVAFLLWFAGARFEMLKNEIDEVLNEYDLKKCIIKHNHILIYAENIINTVRYLIFTAVIVASILIVFSGFLFFFVDSFIIKFQFLILDVVAVIQLYLNSNPAENLIEMSTEIGSAVYNLNWTDKSKMIWRNMYILMQRSQKPVILSVGGFLPALSLSYYMSYLSTCFSYFTTMKAMMQ